MIGEEHTQEQLITFETAKLAKEKGFDLIANSQQLTSHDVGQGVKLTGHSLPTQSLLQKWLRNNYNIWVNLEISNAGIFPEILEIKDGVINVDERVTINKVFSKNEYELALETGLLEALKLINEI